MDGKNEGFLKTVRGDIIEEMAKDHHTFMLMWQIAYRARRSNEFSTDNLKIREALVGDYTNIGLTRRQYRTCLDRLTEWGFVTIKTTNKGTVATIVDERVYDINVNTNGQQTNHPAAIQRPSNDHQEATNKKVKNDKKTYSVSFDYANRTLTGLTSVDIAEWKKAFPAVDIEQQIRSAKQWLIDNPTKRKTAVRRFLTNWLRREQERGGDKASASNNGKVKLYPIKGKNCQCGLPAVYKAQGEYDNWYCLEHSPVNVQERYC